MGIEMCAPLPDGLFVVKAERTLAGDSSREKQSALPFNRHDHLRDEFFTPNESLLHLSRVEGCDLSIVKPTAPRGIYSLMVIGADMNALEPDKAETQRLWDLPEAFQDAFFDRNLQVLRALEEEKPQGTAVEMTMNACSRVSTPDESSPQTIRIPHSVISIMDPSAIKQFQNYDERIKYLAQVPGYATEGHVLKKLPIEDREMIIGSLYGAATGVAEGHDVQCEYKVKAPWGYALRVSNEDGPITGQTVSAIAREHERLYRNEYAGLLGRQADKVGQSLRVRPKTQPAYRMFMIMDGQNTVTLGFSPVVVSGMGPLEVRRVIRQPLKDGPEFTSPEVMAQYTNKVRMAVAA